MTPTIYSVNSPFNRFFTPGFVPALLGCLSLAALPALPAAAAVYHFDWTEDATSYTEFEVEYASFATDNGKAVLTKLAGTTSNIAHLTTTVAALSGQPDAYFDVKLGEVTLSLESANWGANDTKGNIGLFALPFPVDPATNVYRDFFWHPGSGAANTVGIRNHESNGNSSSSGGLAYPKGEQPARLVISHNPGQDDYLFQLFIGLENEGDETATRLAYQRTLSGAEFNGEVHSLGLRFSTQLTSVSGSYGALSISGVVVPEPAAALLGGFGCLALLRRRRDHRLP